MKIRVFSGLCAILILTLLTWSPVLAQEQPMVEEIIVTSSTGVMSVMQGDTLQMVAQVKPEGASPNVKWAVSTYSGPGPGSIDADTGLLTATGIYGTLRVIATAQDGSGVVGVGFVTITPDDSVREVKLDQTLIRLMPGESKQLNAAVIPANNPDVTWKSFNEDVAVVDERGLVTAVGNGAATIGAFAVNNGRSAYCSLIVGEIGDSTVSIKRPIQKMRTIVTTDGEIDDMDSFLRMLLYLNEFELEGIVLTSSQWHYAGDGKGTEFVSPTNRRYQEPRLDLRWCGTDWVYEFIDCYELVYENLIKHDPDFPTADHLRSLVKIGNIEFEGEMEKDTEGSDLIKQVLLDDKPGPVFLQVWGGTNVVARALKSIEEEYRGTDQWDEIYRKVSDKAVIYTVLDQDETYTKYVGPVWPEVRVIYNSAQFWSFAYQWSRAVPEPLQPYLQGSFMSEHIKFNHGPILDRYLLVGDGHKLIDDADDNRGDISDSTRKYDFISEGDTPAFLFLVDVGLRSVENPEYGGWGGRFAQSTDNPRRWEDGDAVQEYNPFTEQMDNRYPQTRWVDVIQNDFAARADWCVNDYENANHAPIVNAITAADILAAKGEEVTLAAYVVDPDGDQVIYKWWQYKEAGSYDGEVALHSHDPSNDGYPQRPSSCFTVPQDAEAGDTIHIILEVTDQGSPNLTRYQRFIVTVK